MQSKHYLPYIDGLRAVAVLCVLIFHLDESLLTGGFVGVDIFFVISGFLITQIIVRDIDQGRFSFMNFYARRIRRIFPALFVMLFISFGAAIIFFPPEQYGYHFQSLRMASAQISNFFFMEELDYFDTGGKSPALLHTWSLGVEEQFYLIWPFLMLALCKFVTPKLRYIPIAFIILISLGGSEYLVRTDQVQAFYMLHSRAWELALGGLIALRILPTINNQYGVQALSLLGLALILYAVAFLEDNHFPGLRAIYPCVGAGLIIYSAANGKGIVHALLSSRIFVFIGLMSYSLYLWHWPIIIFYQSHFGSDLSYSAMGILAALSLIMGYVSYRFVETPFRRMDTSSIKTVLCGVLLIVITIVISNVVKKHSKASWRITAPIAKDVTRPNQWVKTCSDEGGAYDQSCIIGPKKDQYEVLLAGDSHASHFIPTVLDWAKQNDLSVRLFMRGACKTWLDTSSKRIKNGKSDDYCVQLSHDFHELIETNNTIQYVFLAQRHPSGSPEERHSLTRIQNTGKKIRFLGSVAEFKGNPNHCYVKNNLLANAIFPQQQDKKPCYAYDLEYVTLNLEKTDRYFRPMLKELGIPYFDPRASMHSPVNADGHFMYMDDNHLNIYGARFLTPHFIQFMEEHR